MENNFEKIQELEKRINALEVRKIIIKTRIENDLEQHIKRLKERKNILEKEFGLIKNF